MTRKILLLAFVTVAAWTASCAPPDDEALLPSQGEHDTAVATSALIARTKRVAVIPFYYNSTVTSMNNPAGKPLLWDALPPRWSVVDVYFTSTGNDASSGSARGYWSQVSNGNISLTGNIFPWTAVRNARTADAPQNYRPLYLWFDASLPENSANISGGMCIGGWELDANNNPIDVPAVDLSVLGKCLCHDVLSPHFV